MYVSGLHVSAVDVLVWQMSFVNNDELRDIIEADLLQTTKDLQRGSM